MNKRLLHTALLLLFGSIVATAQTAPQRLGDVVNQSETAPQPKDSPDSAEPEDTVQTQVEEMTLDQKIAQVFIVPLQGGLTPNSNDRQFLEAYPPGGILLQDVTKPRNAITLIKAIRDTKKSHGVPILIGTNVFAPSDKERGISELFLRVPSMTAISAANHDAATRDLFALLAEDLSLMGFDFHLGPDLLLASSLDPTKSPDNFGSDPAHTAALGAVFNASLREHHVVWVPAGFPGGGGNKKGRNPAILLTPRNQVFEEDLRPYAQAIEDGINMIHVGNILVPTLDAAAPPASLSPRVMKSLLRQGLNFDGIIVAGPMDAPEITAKLPPAQAVMRSLSSGADMILLNEQGVKALKTIAQVSVAIQKGEFDESIIDAAVTRILQMKIDTGLLGKTLPEEKAADRIETKRGKSNASYTIDRAAITLLKNDNAILPLDKKRSHPVVLTGVEGTKELQIELEEHFKKVFVQRIVSAKHATRIQDFEFKRVLNLTKGARNIIYILSDVADMTTQYELLRQIKAQGGNLIVISLDYPKSARILEPADAVILAYPANHTLQETLKAVSDVLMGDAPVQILPATNALLGRVGTEIQFNVRDVIRSPSGRLPIDLSEAFPAGRSISYAPTLALQKIQWDFGDGKNSSEFASVHVYKEPGEYVATLTIKSKGRDPVIGTFPITIE
jgi:beta-N-acetylhexosaminidase